MKQTLFLFFITVSLCSCSQAQQCPEGINLLPMYGNAKKCPEQLQSDNEFLKAIDKNYTDRKKAAKDVVSRAWDFFNKGDQESAMKRFNQAWLLDSLNADVYWGFGNLLGIQGKFQESLTFFDRSLKLNPSNARVWEGSSTSYGQLFFKTKNIDLLNTSIKQLKTAIKLEPGNARTYAQLTAAYTYFYQKDSARKYLSITDKLDKKGIKPEVRKLLSEE
jgi:tetratricopeptide (TPR) repeat protein